MHHPESGSAVAPWALGGESLVGLVRWRGSPPPLVPPLRPLPGPFVVVASCFTGSPEGAYLEVLVAAPARLGLRAGWSVIDKVIDHVGPQMGSVLNWGFPARHDALLWKAEGDRRVLEWPGGNLRVVGTPSRVPLPVGVPIRALQHRADGPVLVPAWIRGRGRPARVEIESEGGPWAPVSGRHLGIHVSTMRVVVRPARVPHGAVSSLRAPLRAPEAVVWSVPPATRPPSPTAA